MSDREPVDPELKHVDAHLTEAALTPARTHPLAAMLLVWLTPPDWRLRRARQAEGGHWNPETGICEHSA